MTITHLLIANRGEIAIRIARAASELGIATSAVFSEDDALSLHTRMADDAHALKGHGAAAYLDIEQMVRVAKEAGCDAVHPGYGFLSENTNFAKACAAAGIKFVGPNPEALSLFGDKVRARELAVKCNVPLMPGTMGETSLEQVKTFYASLGKDAAVMIKAVSGGGGRGMRVVRSAAEIDEAYARCASEAIASFGSGALYVEKLVEKARHIEIQILGDAKGGVSHLWERECSAQRRNQKIVEIAPSPTLKAEVREKLLDAAMKLAAAAKYDNIGTFEFLLDATDETSFAFMEANPRLQVEHTVTEEVTGIDIVQTQLQVASGKTLKELGLDLPNIPRPRGYAIQLRVNMETMDANGETKPAGGIIGVFEPPSGPGIRVDTFGYAGYRTSPNFDSLLAKLIVSSRGSFADAVRRVTRALSEFRIDGVATNIPFLKNLVKHAAFAANGITTRFVEANVADLVAPDTDEAHRYFPRSGGTDHAEVAHIKGPANSLPVPAPMQAKVVSIDVLDGDRVKRGQQIAVLEAMKMEHLVKADQSGVVRLIAAVPGEVLLEGQPLIFVEPSDATDDTGAIEEKIDLDYIRPDLAYVQHRHYIGLDEARPETVARRHKTNQRTARENIDDLCDPDSFIEYGALVLAAQHRRRSEEDLQRLSPGDGLVAGIGKVNGAFFDDEKSRCMVLSYDNGVFAGTQGVMGHKKKDRMFYLANEWKLPIIFFCEGGGGRPGDTDMMSAVGLDCHTWVHYAKLSGVVPRIAINSQYCFAGNAAFLGSSDVIIATKNSAIGMGGPAMIEGGGLGIVNAWDVGPSSVQSPNGVIDVLVEDEIEAVAAAKKCMAFFQGPIKEWSCADQRTLRHLIPENRLRVYDIRKVIDGIFDTGSVLELRREFGVGIVTALARVEGRPMGVIANNPNFLAGAIESDGADKASRFMQLCDAFNLPIISLCDTPGFMVGTEIEKTAQVRHVCRMFIASANISVPMLTVVVRKAYGLGALGMTAGSFGTPLATVAWPTGEFGAMGIEGGVRLAYKREMAAIADPDERQAFYQKMVDEEYARGKATKVAEYLEIDAVIDPVETRRWITRGLESVPPRQGGSRHYIDAW